jgi:hypothetical protein
VLASIPRLNFAWRSAVTADKIGGMLALTMNDAAVRLLGLHDGLFPAWVPEGIGPGLEGILGRGIVRRGQVVTWAGSAGDTEGAPAGFCDLTSWECFDSSFHLEDFVPVGAVIVDDTPVISESGQKTLLACGLAFVLRFARLVHDLGGPAAIRCLLGVNETNATFRFHQIRGGERWHDPGLDRYQLDKMIVADISRPPAGVRGKAPMAENAARPEAGPDRRAI